MSEFAGVLDSVAALAWVALAFLVVVILRRVIALREGPLRKLGLGPTGVTMEFAEAKLDQAAAIEPDPGARVGGAAKRSVITRMQRHANLLAEARLLWVDDHPENNAPLVELLRGFGAVVDLARSNDQALSLLESSRYDAIVSDVHRDDEGPGSPLKGVELARIVHDRWGRRTILFTARFDPTTLPHASESRRLELAREVQRTVVARTNRGDEVLHLILDELER